MSPENKVVVFMKGTPLAPQCGFSKAVVQILELHGDAAHSCDIIADALAGLEPGTYNAHNILEDAELRTGLKEYS